MDKQKRKRRKGRRYTSGKSTMAGLVLLLVCAVCVIAAVQFFLHRTIDQYDKNIMIQGISVGITDVSGMTKEEAKAAVLADTESIGQEKMTLVLENGDQAETTLTELGLTVKSLDNVLQLSLIHILSRQNLTQRLGRDNFQEQDMRMIAGILGCSFQLSILAKETVQHLSLIHI